MNSKLYFAQECENNNIPNALVKMALAQEKDDDGASMFEIFEAVIRKAFNDGINEAARRITVE